MSTVLCQSRDKLTTVAKMTTSNSKATVYLQPSNYQGLIEFARQRGIPLKTDRHGDPIVGSTIINQALAELLGAVSTVPNTVPNTVPAPESPVLAELALRLEVLDDVQRRLTKLESDRNQSGQTPNTYIADADFAAAVAVKTPDLEQSTLAKK